MDTTDTGARERDLGTENIHGNVFIRLSKEEKLFKLRASPETVHSVCPHNSISSDMGTNRNSFRVTQREFLRVVGPACKFTNRTNLAATSKRILYDNIG